MTVTVPPSVRQRTRAKARVLLEALPYLREHHGRVVVVKLGGAAMTDPSLAGRFAEDVALLRQVGVRPVVVHGGGPQVSAMSERLGLAPSFVDGHRVTDEATLEVARMVLVGLVNKQVTAALNRRGVPAVGISGDDGDALVAVRRTGARGEDLGFVGDVTGVNVALLEHLMQAAVPVLASIATDGHGQRYNVNADLVAATVAGALGAAKLVLLTDVPGVMQDGELVSALTTGEAETMVADGTATGGMVPKLEAVIRALRGGVDRAHIVDGRVGHALLLELFTPEGIGTMVTHEGAPLQDPTAEEAEAAEAEPTALGVEEVEG